MLIISHAKIFFVKIYLASGLLANVAVHCQLIYFCVIQTAN